MDIKTGFAANKKQPQTAGHLPDSSAGWMKPAATQGAATISANDLVSLSALIAYAAQFMGLNEFQIERNLSDRFNIPNIKCLPAVQYDAALRYLVDQVPLAA